MSLVVGDIAVLFPTLPISDCKLTVNATYGEDEPSEFRSISIVRADHFTWKITVTIPQDFEDSTLAVICKVSGAVTITSRVTYTA